MADRTTSPPQTAGSCRTPRRAMCAKLRRCFRAAAWLTVGTLPNHTSCSQVFQESIAEGTGNFLSSTTSSLLSELFLPDWLQNDSAVMDDDGGDDPFAPPAQM